MGEIRSTDGGPLWPADVAVDASARLWVADMSLARVERYTGAGQREVVWESGSRFGPLAIATGTMPDGAPIVAALMTDGSIEVHGAADGILMARWRPTLPDGTMVQVDDLAAGTGGRLYVADLAHRAVHVLQVSAGPLPPPTGDPSPTPTPAQYSCLVDGNKVAGPRRVVLGDSAEVTLDFAAKCPSRGDLVGADIVIAVLGPQSRSGFDASGLEATGLEIVRTLATTIDYRTHRLGGVWSLNGSVATSSLSVDPQTMLDRLAGSQPSADRADRVVQAATKMLVASGRPNALWVLVTVLQVAQSRALGPASAVSNLTAAMEAARAAGVQTFVVTVDDMPPLPAIASQLAGSADRTLVRPSRTGLYPIYGQILQQTGIGLAGNLIVVDEMAPDIAFEPGSAWPPAQEAGGPTGDLRWSRTLLPASGLTMTYAIVPHSVGTLPTNRRAVAYYTDFDGSDRSYVFPVPEIEVVAPTPTSTATATPEPTATPHPVPVPLFLPIALREACNAGRQRVDVVLVLDASLTMSGDKLAAAKSASKIFVGLLSLPQDQAAVVGFSRTATLAIALTSDRGALERAIDGLSVTPGTRIDLGLRAGVDELLAGANRRPDNRPVALLLSDGLHQGLREDVLAESARARAAGVRLFTIGLGADSDETLLRNVGDPGGYFYAPHERNLEGIYRSIAAAIPCH